LVGTMFLMGHGCERSIETGLEHYATFLATLNPQEITKPDNIELLQKIEKVLIGEIQEGNVPAAYFYIKYRLWSMRHRLHKNKTGDDIGKTFSSLQAYENKVFTCESWR